MTILDKIIEHKKREVAEAKKRVSVAALEQSAYFRRIPFSLKSSLLDKDKTGIIAEFKRQSPSKGVINGTADVLNVTEAYTKYGASGLSVLTDENFFGGTIDDLQKARANQIPILRKDFIVDEYQIIEAKSIGADVILLIAACLTPQEVKHLAGVAKSLQLEILLELHNDEELQHVCDAIDLVGINNRNLKTFEVDVENSIRLRNQLPKDKLAIAESGIENVETVVTLKVAGFNGFLIGEHFMKHTDPAIAFADYVTKLKKQ